MPQEHVPFYNRINNVEYGGKHRYTAKYFISEVYKSKGLMCFQQKLKGLKKNCFLAVIIWPFYVQRLENKSEKKKLDMGKMDEVFQTISSFQYVILISKYQLLIAINIFKYQYFIKF